jgi:hypothetical protein
MSKRRHTELRIEVVAHRFDLIDQGYAACSGAPVWFGMVEVYVQTQIYGPLVLVFLRGMHEVEPKYRGLFVDCRYKRCFLGRAPVIDEAAQDRINQLQYNVLPAVIEAAKNRPAGYCRFPLGHPEWCWASNHGPQPDLSAYRDALERAWSIAQWPFG